MPRKLSTDIHVADKNGLTERFVLPSNGMIKFIPFEETVDRPLANVDFEVPHQEKDSHEV